MKKDKTKQKIINTSLKLFLLNGYDKTSMNDIVRESGITKGGIYYHFTNKDDLFLAVIKEISSFVDEWGQKIMIKAKSTKELVRYYFISASEIMNAFMSLCPDEEVTSIHYYQFMIDSLKRFSNVRDTMGESYSHLGNLITGQILLAQQKGEIRSDLNAENLAFHLNALMEGLINMTIVYPELDLVEKGNQMFNDFWKLIKA
ncbi:TetR/AcrR family transcriptional regulator [Candidatus Cloacimonadota bacterium]